jgi:hypothetical protein
MSKSVKLRKNKAATGTRKKTPMIESAGTTKRKPAQVHGRNTITGSSP